MHVSGQLHASPTLPSVRDTGNHWIGGSVGPGASLDDMEKKKIPQPGIEPRSYSQ
jgi:hypothetical protein